MYYSEYLDIMKKLNVVDKPWIRQTYEYNTTLGAFATEISSKYTTMYFGNTDLLKPK